MKAFFVVVSFYFFIFLFMYLFTYLFLIIKGFVKHLRIQKMTDIKSGRRFDDSMSSLSISKYMAKLIIYIVTKLENI